MRVGQDSKPLRENAFIGELEVVQGVRAGDAGDGFFACGFEGFHLGFVGADELHHLPADLGGVAIEGRVAAPHELVRIRGGEIGDDTGGITVVAVKTAFAWSDVGEVIDSTDAVNAVRGVIEPSVRQRLDAVEAFFVVAAGVRRTETDVGVGFGDVDDVMCLRPEIVFGDAAVNDERHIPLAGEVEEDFAFMGEAFDVGLDDGALDFDAVEAVFAAQLDEFDGLRVGAAHGIDHHEGQDAFTFLGEELLAFLQQAAVLKSIRYGFEPPFAKADAAAAELSDVHGRITHEGKGDPMRDAERAALLLHLRQLL